MSRKTKKRTLSLFVAAVMLLSLLAGCTNEQGAGTPSPTASTPVESAAPSAAPSELEELGSGDVKWSEEKYQQVKEYSGRTSRAWLAATAMARYTPSPFNGFDLLNHMAVMVTARGKKEAAEAMETLLKDNAGVNLEQKGQQLFFNLWKCHQWGEYTLYYFPVKFVEELNPELKRIAISFINGMANANGIATILDGDETDMVLDWLETRLSQVSFFTPIVGLRKYIFPESVGPSNPQEAAAKPATVSASVYRHPP